MSNVDVVGDLCVGANSAPFLQTHSVYIDSMGKAPTPELKKYMDRRLFLQLNGNRKVTGVLRGFDPFMNVVLEDASEELPDGEKNHLGSIVIRGNSIGVMEAMERVPA
ncbi:hypothetical protein BASA50_002002 [Batrachochytrium salamandrivorans]|uniref:Small nuclear ribonucleoprotein G n=1 Tax=Batrachochytrium salamandrivorans TaxID=1357716 RepID=A0ABQ8FN49_9FUNG|nr:hypothetical protein BASA60_007588 [Batrachochytrium salamandrivorans]KAH6573188.1 hypothetical protein BASA62_003086 [Batrachochytrium salamandrivorans]KAH6583864.1 hypothetical protein BASA61_007822 [Batrachochytrium salamandrivorans]KAH6600895.1 hypothetical protein BASA50_002002 [Batrachochytrium salamandrivorans]KAH9250114.1 hypothetical protein BASA81_012066 [Batrachochytrium salamandrivorans]